ncbi:hypothetical protein ACI7RC_05265 [Brevibacillus sp. B_LB10_24]|uniref:hypothetical protein n=1 Tax=Brevibacillus sp. B_LB10_24 TaxID=3380645 RepID=UPI0038BC4A48
MDAKTRVIIAEIEKWQRTQLLPEHYCIFLLKLYSGGEHTGIQQDGNENASNKRGNGLFAKLAGSFAPGKGNGQTGNSSTTRAKAFVWLIGMVVTAISILLAFHFSDFPTAMQIAFVAIFSLLFYGLAFILRKRTIAGTNIALALAFFAMAAGGLFLLQKTGASLPVMLLFLAAACLLWYVTGLLFRLAYLQYCGLVGLGLIYGYEIIGLIAADPSFLHAQLYWVPLAAVMIGLGFMLRRSRAQAGGVLAVCGLLFLFGSEVCMLFIPGMARDVIQLLLFVKILLGSALFFVTRRTWLGSMRL